VRELFPQGDFSGGIAVPLVLHETVIGIMATAREDGPPFGENDLRLMRSASQQATLAIRNTQLYNSLRSYAELLEQRVEERSAALENTQKQLIRSEKLASLGRLAGEIAHEVNNPLQPIMSSLERALEDLEAENPIDSEDLSMAVSEVERLKRIVKRLLDFARPDTGGMRPTDMSGLIKEIIRFTSKRIEHAQVKVETDLQPIDPIEVNPDQIQQVILNLIINAADAMTHTKDGRLEVHLWQADEYAHIKVKDNGEGIAPDLVSRIFEPFFSTKDEGSGLGLSISHSIVEAHGGQIDVQSQPGVGTEFRISLPMA
jgi:two-component system NtrC family sensor kinase